MEAKVDISLNGFLPLPTFLFCLRSLGQRLSSISMPFVAQNLRACGSEAERVLIGPWASSLTPPSRCLGRRCPSTL